MLSTIGTALGSTYGSCRPFARSLTDSLSRVTVSCSKLMVAVGLNATCVEVVHPQQKVPAPTAHERPCQQEVERIAKMQVAAGGGGESGAEGFRNRNQLGLAISGTCCQTGLACWKAWVNWRTPSSSRERPTICKPTGRPSSVNPHGTEIAGSPVTVMK